MEVAQADVAALVDDRLPLLLGLLAAEESRIGSVRDSSAGLPEASSRARWYSASTSAPMMITMFITHRANSTAMMPPMAP